MWKFVSRSFRESLERGLGFSRSTGNCQEPPRQQKCSKFTSFSRATSKARVCSTPHWPECQNRQQSQGSSHTPPPNEEETQQRNGTQFGQDSKECILGAFSCVSTEYSFFYEIFDGIFLLGAFISLLLYILFTEQCTGIRLGTYSALLPLEKMVE